jgi:hypothetical protein
MTESDRIKYLRVALLVVGLIFIGLWPLTIVWPSGGPGTPEVVRNTLR